MAKLHHHSFMSPSYVVQAIDQAGDLLASVNTTRDMDAARKLARSVLVLMPGAHHCAIRAYVSFVGQTDQDRKQLTEIFETVERENANGEK